MKRSREMALGLLALSYWLAGCGVQASQYIHVQGTIVHLRIVSGFSNKLNMPTIDGVQATDHLTISVPKSSNVQMTVLNKGPFPEGFGIYNASWDLAVAHAGDPWFTDAGLNAVAGLTYGQSKTYTFTAAHTGTYTLADLFNNPGNALATEYAPTTNVPQSNIWATFNIAHNQKVDQDPKRPPAQVGGIDTTGAESSLSRV